MATAEPAQLSDIFAALRRRWGLIAIFSTLGIVLGALAWAMVPPSHTATVRVAVNPVQPGVLTATSDPESSVNMATESQVMTSNAVASAAAGELGVDVGMADVRAATSVEVPEESLVLVASYTARTRGEAADGVAAVANAYLDRRQRIIEDQVDRLRLAAARQIVTLDEWGDRPGNDTEVAQRSLERQADALGTRSAELSNLDLEPGSLLGPATVPGEGSGLALPAFLVAGLALGTLIGAVVALTRREKDDRSIRDVLGLDERGVLMTLDGTADAEWDHTWDLAATMLTIPSTLPRGKALTIVVDAEQAHGRPAGQSLVSALDRRGRKAKLIDARTISDSKINRGWPSEGSWAGELVVIDSTTLESDALKVNLAGRADMVLLSRTTDDDAPGLARLQSLLRSKGVTIDLTVLFPARPEFVSLTP